MNFDPKIAEVFDQLAGWWTVKSETSVFTYMNRGLADAMGFRHPQDSIGRTDEEVPSRISEYAEAFRAQDQRVIHSQGHLRTLEVHPMAGDHWRACIVNKSFRLDPKTGAKQVICHAADLTSAGMVELGAALGSAHVNPSVNPRSESACYKIGQPDNADLTRRESEVLFFVLRGRNAKAIARVLGLSPRTVEQYIDVLKQKFGANSRAALIDAALAADCFHFIPDSLFCQQLSLILSE